jgi:hypothetical protein
VTVMEKRVRWRIAGEETGSCNCAWGCPCQFNALPTTGRCQAVVVFDVHEGQFGSIALPGTRFAWVISFPGAVHEGNGTRLTVLDEGATDEQREAVVALTSGQQGGVGFEIFASVCPNEREPVVASIGLESDRERRLARIRIPGIAETKAEPIRNPVTGEEHRARIDLPNGFEYKIAEVANTVYANATAGGELDFTLENSYAQFNRFDWSNA